MNETTPHTPLGATFWYIALAITVLGGIGSYEYSDVIRVQNREDGRSAILELVERQNRHFARHQRYATSLEALDYAGVEDFSIPSPGGHYRILLLEGDDKFYVAAAEPQGEQTADTPCAPLTYASRGHAKGSRGSGGSGCW